MIQIDHTRCDTCGTCVGVCPNDALTIALDRLAFDAGVCIDCRACVVVCPVDALRGVDG